MKNNNLPFLIFIKRSISVLLILCGVILFFIMVTYYPADPSHNSVSTDNIPVHNMFGYFGAYVADMVMQSIGYTIYFFIPLFFVMGGVLWNHLIIHLGYRIVVFICIIPFLCLLSQSIFAFHVVQPGGVLGYVMYLGTVRPYPQALINSFLFAAFILYLWILGVFQLRSHHFLWIKKCMQSYIKSNSSKNKISFFRRNLQNVVKIFYKTSGQDSSSSSSVSLDQQTLDQQTLEQQTLAQHTLGQQTLGQQTTDQQPHAPQKSTLFSLLSSMFSSKQKLSQDNMERHNTAVSSPMHAPSFLRNNQGHTPVSMDAHDSKNLNHSMNMEQSQEPLTSVAPTSVAPTSVGSDDRSNPLIHKPLKSITTQDRSGSHTSSYVFPTLDLLSVKDDQTHISQTELEEQSSTLEQVLQDFGIKGHIISVRPGPVVTMFELSLPPGIKSSRVISLADDIARHMQSLSCRISTIPGEKTLGIELPNKKREMFGLKSLLQSEVYRRTKALIPLVLGRGIFGNPVIGDLSAMPHLLVAGTTGSGKSVGINTFIVSLLYRFTPEECRFVMIDPKMLELSVYEGIPHLLTSVVTDPKLAAVALRWVVTEMEDRYTKMAKLGVRNVANYNAYVEQSKDKVTVYKKPLAQDDEIIFQDEKIELAPLPYIVVIVDEMADLMLVAGKEIEASIQRIAQMARAAGIHLIMATQRPSVDVITGTIKANFPSRISYALSSRIDSRVIISESGAEQLLGKGDMLFMPNGGKLDRVHGPFVSDEEVQHICAFIKKHNPHAKYINVESMEDKKSTQDSAGYESGTTDSLYDEAISIVKQNQKASTSYLQRRLRVGYNKAADLIERMEQDGYISEPDRVGKRKIYIEQDDH